jgi:heptosyltransferase-3
MKLASCKKALVIKLRHLGDVLLTSPIFTLLKKEYPQIDIDAYVYQESVPVLEGHPSIHNIFTYDRAWKKGSFFSRIAKEYDVLHRLRAEKYDLVINLTEGDRGALVAWYSGAKIRVGLDPQGKGFYGKKKLYTHIVKHCGSPRHTVERNLDALRVLGIFPQEKERELLFPMSQETLHKVAQDIKEYGLVEKDFILIHPSSRWKFKCWSIIKYQELIGRLLDRKEKVVISGGIDPIEKKMIEDILKPFGNAVINLTGQISIKELGAWIFFSKLLFCVDSLPLHIASALKSRVVVLFGPSSDLQWGPWQNPRATVIRKNISCRPCSLDGCGGSKGSDCLFSLSVDEVFSALYQ